MKATPNIVETTTYADSTTETLTLLAADKDHRCATISREVANTHGDIVAAATLRTAYGDWDSYATGDIAHTITYNEMRRLVTAAKRLAEAAESKTA